LSGRIREFLNIPRYVRSPGMYWAARINIQVAHKCAEGRDNLENVEHRNTKIHDRYKHKKGYRRYNICSI
jgi:hypothetical protein